MDIKEVKACWAYSMADKGYFPRWTTGQIKLLKKLAKKIKGEQKGKQK